VPGGSQGPQGMSKLEARHCIKRFITGRSFVGFELTVIKKSIAQADVSEVSDRRTELRFGTDQPVMVSVLAPIAGRIDGASKSGLRVTLSVALKVGAFVEVKWDRAIVVGRVRYCRQAGQNKYHIGLKITEVVGAGKLRTKPKAA
jgi:hypothetical protein